MRFLNECEFRAVSGGLTDFVVASAITGWYTPAQCTSPAVVDGGVYHWRAESDDGTQYESFEGAYTAASTTVARTTIIQSSNGGAPVNFSAAPRIRQVVLAPGFVASVVAGTNITVDATDPANPIVSADGYTDEQAQDAVGGILVETDTIALAYDDDIPSISATLKDTAITPGDYTNANITVDQQGRIAAAANGSAGAAFYFTTEQTIDLSTGTFDSQFDPNVFLHKVVTNSGGQTNVSLSSIGRAGQQYRFELLTKADANDAIVFSGLSGRGDASGELSVWLRNEGNYTVLMTASSDADALSIVLSMSAFINVATDGNGKQFTDSLNQLTSVEVISGDPDLTMDIPLGTPTVQVVTGGTAGAEPILLPSQGIPFFIEFRFDTETHVDDEISLTGFGSLQLLDGTSASAVTLHDEGDSMTLWVFPNESWIVVFASPGVVT